MIEIYRGKKNGKGSACLIKFNEDKANVTFAIANQTDWDDGIPEFAEPKNAEDYVSFDMEKHSIAQIISSLRRNKQVILEKTKGKVKLELVFKPFLDENEKQLGYSLTIYRTDGDEDDEKFSIGIDFGYALLIERYLDNSLSMIFAHEDYGSKASKADISAPTPAEEAEPKKKKKKDTEGDEDKDKPETKEKDGEGEGKPKEDGKGDDDDDDDDDLF